MSYKTIKLHTIKLIAAVIAVSSAFAPLSVSAANCVTPTTDYGSGSASVTTPEAATYRIWTRIMVPDTTNNTYLLQVENNGANTCFTVGGAGVQSGKWTWVAYQNGNTSNRTDMALAKGAHAVKMIGNAPGVKVDRLVFSSDLNCTPTSVDGSECNNPTDSAAPTLSLTAPAAGSTVAGTVDVTANATDNVGVTKVEFYVDSQLKATSTVAPYSFQWNTAELANKNFVLIAKAYDAAGNIRTDSVEVTVQNGDQQAPSAPSNLKATAPTYSTAKLTWDASTDNVGVKSYIVYRNTVPVGEITAPSYQDSGLIASTSYRYQVAAKDAAGNVSALSAATSVTTPAVADTVAPSKPGSLSGEAVSSSQINLTWQASTDNIGVKAYDVYRATGNGGATKIGQTSTTSFGDNSLNASTSYSYYVKAVDASGNASDNSDTVSVTTKEAQKRAVLAGRVRNSRTNKPIPNAYVVINRYGKKNVYTTNSNGHYVFRKLESARYDVSYFAWGYRSQTITVRIDNNRVTRDVSLEKR